MSASSVRTLVSLTLTALISIGVCSRSALADYLFYGTPGEAVAAQMAADLGSVFVNLQNARLSKADFNARFADARVRIAASCARKAHDEAAETELMSLLNAKDIYFLTGALAGAAARDPGRVQALENITGGPIDGGIPLHAEFMFDRWANSVKAELRGAAAWNASAIVSAISRSQQTYIQYVAFRNKAEIDGFLRKSGQSQDMLDPSPEALADAYLSNVLKPAIAKSSKSPADTTAENRWADEVRAAIVAYENADLDPKAIADYLRRVNYPADIVKRFLDKTNAPNADLTQAYEDAWEDASARQGNPGMIPPSRNKLLLDLKSMSSKGAVISLGRLMNNDALAKVGLQPVDEYLSKRETLKILLGPSRDWCTGEPLPGAGSRIKRADVPVRNEAADAAKTAASKPSVFAARPAMPAEGAGRKPPESDQAVTPTIEQLGLTLQKVNDQLREKYGLSDNVKGVVVTEVAANTPAAEKQLQAGDAILEVDHKPVTTPQEITEILGKLQMQKKRSVLLLVERQGGPRFAALRLTK